MERLQPLEALPFEVGALYSRRDDIHARLGGQRQGGISTPANSRFVILFTGEAGKQHGHADRWDDDGVFHYYGEGQRGDMQDRGGNLAIRKHLANGNRLLLSGRNCGAFSPTQAEYLEFHRNAVFGKAFKRSEDPLLELLATTAP